MTAQLLQPGDTVTHHFGPLQVRTDRHHDGIAISVLVGCRSNSALSNTFPTGRETAARIWFKELMSAAQGVPVHVIEDRLAVIQSAAHAAEQALTDGSQA